MWLVGLIEGRHLDSLARFRARSAWQCLPVESEPNAWWIRVPVGDDSLFSQLPLAGRWKYREQDGSLVRPGSQLPERVIAGSWEPIASLIAVGKVQETIPGMAALPIGFRLIEADTVAPIELLHCPWRRFSEWSEQVLVQRLECLRIALNGESHCLVKGEPLPGIAGQSFYRKSRIYLPAGFALPEFTWPELVESALGLSAENEQALIFPEGEWVLLTGDIWIKGSREAMRVNQQQLS